MKAITVRQPWASLIAAGVKTIETRPRPTSYRGRIAIHAGKAPPDIVGLAGDDVPVGQTIWPPHDAGYWIYGYADDGGRLPLPLGAVVASAVLTDCVPIVNEADPDPDGPFVYADLGNFIQVHDGPDDRVPRYSENEVHLGDFSPGRWALLLDDIKPTTERCPWCWGDGLGDYLLTEPGDRNIYDVCVICGGDKHCVPVPARGQHAIPWEWTP